MRPTLPHHTVFYRVCSVEYTVKSMLIHIAGRIAHLQLAQACFHRERDRQQRCTTTEDDCMRTFAVRLGQVVASEFGWLGVGKSIAVG
jgi:hypothetical protein